jgi:hypothetical protein
MGNFSLKWLNLHHFTIALSFRAIGPPQGRLKLGLDIYHGPFFSHNAEKATP